MPMPIASNTLASPSHSTLHNHHVDVKAFGADPTGVADSSTAIQAAIDSAVTVGHGRVYLPAGAYKITSTLSITGLQPVRLTGEHSRHGEDAGSTSKSGTGIFGTINGPLLERTDVGEEEIVIENIAFRNQHASGKAVSLAAMRTPSSIRNCALHAFICLEVGNNVFEFDIENCQFRNEGAYSASSRGITGTWAHGNITACDFNGFGRGISLANTLNVNIFGARIEVCGNGLFTDTCGGVYEGIYFEACDIGIEGAAFGGTISGCTFNGTTGSPSGGSTNGMRISGGSGVVVGCGENGGHSGTFFTVWNGPMTFIGCRSTTAWSLPGTDATVHVINCSPEANRTGGIVRLESDISPAQLTANTDNWNPTGLSTASIIRLSTNASLNITGIVGGADGRQLILMNVGTTNNAVLVHDATSTAANRFFCPGSANFTLTPNSTVVCIYDSTSSRWRVK